MSHSPSPRQLVALALASCLAAPAPAQDLPSFRADLLPGQPGQLHSLAGVTDQGLVAGSVSVDGHGRAFVADDSGFTLLPLPAGNSSCLASDINEAGLVVGQAYGPFPPVAVVWTPGPSGYDVLVVPPDGGNTPSLAYGCNDRGDVVGRTDLGHPWVWSAADGTTDLWVSMGLGWQLQDLNESRVGVGGGVRVDLDAGLIDELAPPAGSASLMLSSINDAGTVAGYAVKATSQPDAFQATRYQDSLGWKTFNLPIPQANALAVDAADDTLFQLFYDGSPYLHVEGLGSAVLDSLIDPSTPGWSSAHGGAMSRSGRLAVPASNSLSGASGVIVLTRLPFVNLGGSTPGLTGRPVLRGEGSLVPGADVRLRLLNARPSSSALLLGSLGAAPAAFKGGVLHALPALLQVWLSTDAAGQISLQETWPALPAGTELVLQFGLLDAASPYGAVLSNGLSGTSSS